MLYLTKECKRECCCIVIAAMIYGLNKGILIHHVSGWLWYFCVSHLNDLVCPLFFLGYVQIVLKWVGLDKMSYAFCVLIGMSAGVVWEYFAPIINAKAVTDSLDLIYYFVGINIYSWISKFVNWDKKSSRNY